MSISKSMFTTIIKEFGPRFMKDMNCTKEDAAAVFGNLAHESGGFTVLQERRPAVKGSRGGYGWAQWTGPRRVKFETFCKTNKLDPSAPETNYGFLLEELNGPYKNVMGRVGVQHTLFAKVASFERNYEGAGILNMKSRFAYATQALALL